MAVDRELHRRLMEGYELLLLGYAAGILDQAQDLIVSSHLALSPAGRQFVGRCESIGGALLEHECAPVSMSHHSLQACLEKLDQPEPQPSAASEETLFPEDIDLPCMLKKILCAQRKRPHWHRSFYGMKSFSLELECKNSAAKFMKIDPAVSTPTHGHRGIEITLVLDGAFTDGVAEYQRGDLIVADEDLEHKQTTHADQGCTCFVVSSAPIKLSGLASLLNPFLRR